MGGHGAVRYFDLKQNRTTNYNFSFGAMLDPRGNTAVYLLYAYARICSIFRKGGVTEVDSKAIKLVHPKERELCMEVLRFPEVLEQVQTDLHLSHLATYTYTL